MHENWHWHNCCEGNRHGEGRTWRGAGEAGEDCKSMSARLCSIYFKNENKRNKKHVLHLLSWVWGLGVCVGGRGGAVVEDIFGLHNFDILELNQTRTSKSLNSISSQISEDDKRVRNDRDVCKNLSLCS